jgi:glycogen synthase
MRIAFVTTEYTSEPIFDGGLANYLARTAGLLLERGHEVEVFTRSRASSETILRDGIVVHRVKSGWWLGRMLGRLPQPYRMRALLSAWNIAKPLATALEQRHAEVHFDVAQVASCRACGLVAASRRRLPIVTRVSSYQPLWREAYCEQPTPEKLKREQLELNQLRKSMIAYAPSHLVANAIRERHGLDVAVIEPPYDATNIVPEAISPPTDFASGSYALFFGTLGRMKGCDRLLQVIPRVIEKNPDFRFLFIGKTRNSGDGNSFEQIFESQVGRFGDRVLCLPSQRHEELFRYVRHARFVVLPSRVDNLPNACLESMALEKVIIGTRQASFEQLIEHDHSGFLVAQEDNDELQIALERAWTLPEADRQRLGKNARDSLFRFHPKNSIAALTTCFESAIERFKSLNYSPSIDR